MKKAEITKLYEAVPEAHFKRQDAPVSISQFTGKSRLYCFGAYCAWMGLSHRPFLSVLSASLQSFLCISQNLIPRTDSVVLIDCHVNLFSYHSTALRSFKATASIMLSDSSSQAHKAHV
jgi:hypothetical protein